MTDSNVLVLFCGEEFGRGFQYTHEACSRLKGITVTRCPRRDLEQHIGRADILVPLMTRLDRSLLSKATKVKLILQYGVGLEGVDIEMDMRTWECRQTLFTKPLFAGNSAGNSGGDLTCLQQVAPAYALWLFDQAPPLKAHEMEVSIQNRILGQPVGETLFGKTVLIVGFGNISRELIPRLKPLGTRLLGVRQSAWHASDLSEASGPEQLLDLRGSWSQLHDVAPQADIVVLTCTQTPATRGMVGAAFLERCKPGVVIINVARGGLLDYDAVKAGLSEDKIGALGLDVQWQEPFDPEDEIAKHPRVYLTPHVAGVTELSYRGMARVVADEARRFQQGLPATVRINHVPQPA